MLLALLLLSQSDQTSFTVREEKPSGFTIEGTTTAREETLVRVELFRDGAEEGAPVWFGVAPVKDGRFQTTANPFKEKNLKGRYLFRIRVRGVRSRQTLVVGSEEDIKAELEFWKKRIDLELAEMTEPDPDKIGEIVRRNSDIPEFKFLGLTAITHGEFEHLRTLAAAGIEYQKNVDRKPQEAEIWRSTADMARLAFQNLRHSIRAQLGLEEAAKPNPEGVKACVAETVDWVAKALEDGRVRAELAARIENRRMQFRVLQADFGKELAGGKEFFEHAAALGENPTREGSGTLREKQQTLLKSLE